MAIFKNNKEEAASELVERLTPKFDLLLEKLRDISDAIEKIGVGDHNIPGEVRPETSANELTSETEELKRQLVDLDKKLNTCERERSSASEQLEAEKRRYSDVSELEERFNASQVALKLSEEESEKNAAMVENLQLDLMRVKEASSLKIDELEKKLTDSDGAVLSSQQNLDSCRSELEQFQTTLKDSLIESSEKISELTQQVSDITGEKMAASAKVQEMSSKLTNLLHDLDLLSNERDTLTQVVARMQRESEVDGKLESLMWPKFLETPEMQDWKLRMEETVHQEISEENAVVLVANLFNYNAIVGLGSEWHRRMFDVLHDFSRAFFAWCESLHYDQERSVIEARLWAKQFSENSSGEFSIEIPEPDEPFDKRVMVSYESGGASTSRDVKAVKTWCIKDGAGRILKQAEVTTC